MRQADENTIILKPTAHSIGLACLAFDPRAFGCCASDLIKKRSIRDVRKFTMGFFFPTGFPSSLRNAGGAGLYEPHARRWNRAGALLHSQHSTLSYHTSEEL